MMIATWAALALSPCQFARAEFAEAGKPMKVGGIQFVWIPTGGASGLWITDREVAAGPYEKNHGGREIDRVKEAGGFPADWSVRRPAEGEWTTARKLATQQNLQNFNDGLGEVLDDGRIIGAADGFPKSSNLGVLSHQARVDTTRIMISPERRSPDMRNPIVVPAVYQSESRFATRIVIVPGQTEVSSQPAAAEPMRLAAAGVLFYWIGDGEDGVFFSRDECDDVDFDAIVARLRKAGMVEEEWKIGRPTREEWLAARAKAGPLGLNDMDDGFGEVLACGSVIGRAVAFPDSRELEILALPRDERIARTRLPVRPERAASLSADHPRPAVIPARFLEEREFATRLVARPVRR